MDRSEYLRGVKALSGSINDVIKSYGLIDDLENGKNTNWEGNLQSIANKEFSWLKTDYDAKYDMLVDMYTKTFVDRVGKVFSKYTPMSDRLKTFIFKSVEEIPQIKHKNKIINPNEILNYKKFDKNKIVFKNSDNNEMYRIVAVDDNNKGIVVTAHLLGLSTLESYLHFIMVRAAQEVSKYWYKRYTDMQEAYEYDDETSDDALDRLKLESGEYDFYESMPLVDQIAFDNLISLIKDHMNTDEGQTEKNVTVFEMLMDGYSPSEIARFMEVSSAKISQRIKIVKQSILDVAEYLHAKGDKTLLKLFKDYQDMFKQGILKRAQQNPMTKDQINFRLQSV